MKRGNWSESQFKKAKVAGNENLWSEAAEALESKVMEDNLVARFKKLQRQQAQLENQVVRLHAELRKMKAA